MNHHWRYEKVLNLEEAKAVAAKLRDSGKKLVTVNGSFDLLHAGHLDILEEAKQQGDILFVGMNSDASVRDGKGKDRPFIPEQERAAMLAALVCVDYVIIIDEPYNKVHDVLIEAIKPDIHANGSEYGPPEKWIEWPMLQKVGAKGYVVERREGLATSDIVSKIAMLALRQGSGQARPVNSARPVGRRG